MEAEGNSGCQELQLKWELLINGHKVSVKLDE